VLRSENRGQHDAFARGDPVDHVQKAAVYRRVVADDAEAKALETVGAESNVGAEADGGGHPLKK